MPPHPHPYLTWPSACRVQEFPHKHLAGTTFSQQRFQAIVQYTSSMPPVPRGLYQTNLLYFICIPYLIVREKLYTRVYIWSALEDRWYASMIIITIVSIEIIRFNKRSKKIIFRGRCFIVSVIRPISRLAHNCHDIVYQMLAYRFPHISELQISPVRFVTIPHASDCLQREVLFVGLFICFWIEK